MARLVQSTAVHHRVNISAVTVETFSPNYAVDGLTGKTIMNNAIIRGIIKAQLFYGSTKTIIENYVIDLENEPYYTYICGRSGSDDLQITLPDPKVYDGCELRFFGYVPQTRFDNLWHLEGKMRYANPNNNYIIKSADKIWPKNGIFLQSKHFKAIG